MSESAGKNEHNYKNDLIL